MARSPAPPEAPTTGRDVTNTDIATEPVAAVVAPRDLAHDTDPLAPAWKPGQLHLIGPLAVPFHTPRLVRIYLPSTFGPELRRPLLVMFDGQNMFEDLPSYAGGWHLDRAVERLATGPRVAPIAIGIDHGGETRIQELSPFNYEDEPGRLDSFLEWIVGTLLPRLGEELPLVTGALGTIAGGSSMGGLAALYTHLHYPEAFGGALAMSPSLWLSDGEIQRWIPRQPRPDVSRIYLDCGVREGRGRILPLVAAVAASLADRGWDEQHLMFRPDMRGAHNERSWRRRLPKALRFLYRCD